MEKYGTAINEFDILFAQKIKERRKEYGFSQEDVVCKMQLLGVDITQSCFSKIERACCSACAYVALLLAEILAIDLGELVFELSLMSCR